MSEAKPTPGPWYAKNHVVHTDAMPKRFWGEANQYSGPYIVMQTGLYSGPDDATTYANARLVADAGTVFHTTGLTPSQLVERVKELESSHKVTLGLLQELAAYDTYQTEYDGRMYSICNDCGGQDGEHRDDCAYTRANKHIAALSKARPNTAEGE